MELTGIIILSFSLCWQFVLLGICSGTKSTLWCFGRRSPASVGRSECSLVHSDLYKVDQSINTILGHTRKDYSPKVTHIVYSTFFYFWQFNWPAGWPETNNFILTFHNELSHAIVHQLVFIVIVDSRLMFSLSYVVTLDNVTWRIRSIIQPKSRHIGLFSETV